VFGSHSPNRTGAWTWAGVVTSPSSMSAACTSLWSSAEWLMLIFFDPLAFEGLLLDELVLALPLPRLALLGACALAHLRPHALHTAHKKSSDVRMNHMARLLKQERTSSEMYE